jgi:hypothetical protein
MHKKEVIFLIRNSIFKTAPKFRFILYIVCLKNNNIFAQIINILNSKLLKDKVLIKKVKYDHFYTRDITLLEN